MGELICRFFKGITVLMPCLQFLVHFAGLCFLENCTIARLIYFQSSKMIVKSNQEHKYVLLLLKSTSSTCSRAPLSGVIHGYRYSELICTVL